MASAKRGEPCEQCHKVHLKCLGHWNQIPDKPCNHKEVGSLEGKTGFCIHHGGRAIAKRTYEKIRRNEKIANYLHQMDLVPVGDPMEDLENAVAQAKAIYNYYLDTVGQMKTEQQRYQSQAGIEQLRSEVALMERALDRYMKGLETLQKLRRAAGADNAGETLLDLIKSGIEARP